MRIIRGAVIADWKLFPIPRKTTWNTVGFAIFDGPYKDPKKIKKYLNDSLMDSAVQSPAFFPLLKSDYLLFST